MFKVCCAFVFCSFAIFISVSPVFCLIGLISGYVKNIHKSENEIYVCHEAEQPDFPSMMFAGKKFFVALI